MAYIFHINPGLLLSTRSKVSSIDINRTFDFVITILFANMASSTYVLYNYTPSLVGSVIFAALFLLTTTFHLYQRIRSHAKYFNPFIAGGLC